LTSLGEALLRGQLEEDEDEDNEEKLPLLGLFQWTIARLRDLCVTD